MNDVVDMASVELLSSKNCALYNVDSLFQDLAALNVKKVTTCSRLTKKFEGDDWKLILPAKTEKLRKVFISEAAEALMVSRESITDVSFRLGSLYVTFHVTHDEDISEEEMEQRIEEFPFREMWRLYNERDQPPDGLDAALQRIAELEKELKESEKSLHDSEEKRAKETAALENKLQAYEEEVGEKAAERERELQTLLGKEQSGRKQAEAQLRSSEEQNKKLTDAMKKEKARSDKQAVHQNELIAAIIQENKKEKEAMEREHLDEIELKDYIIENLKAQLQDRTATGNAAPAEGNDYSDEFAKLMSRMEEMAAILEQTQEAESEARARILQLSEALKRSEAAREAESVNYENNMVALRQQFNAFRETKLAEDHQARAQESRAARGSSSNDAKENETIVRQYETALENIIGTFQDRLNVLKEEYVSFLGVAKEEVQNERSILEEHEKDSRNIRQVFRTSSVALQKVFWGSREAEASAVVHTLDKAASDAEKSSAAIKMTLDLLDSKMKNIPEQKEWMDSHQETLQDLIKSLRSLNKRAFERQLSLMNKAN